MWVSTYLTDPVALETEEQTLKREQTDRDVLEALCEYKCDSGMSRFITQQSSILLSQKRIVGPQKKN